MWWNGPDGWGMGFGIISMVLFWVLGISLVVFIVRGLRGSPETYQHPHSKKPLEILQERYVRGEIDKKEYEEKKKDLS